ncbi:hypothetical protein D9M70_407340 [compost metagenome]
MGTLGRFLELNRHAFGNDPGRVVADAHHRPQQRGFLFGTGTGLVGPQAHRQAIDLQEFSQIADGVVLEQVGPGEHSIETAARHIAGLGLVGMDDPAERIQGLAFGAAISQAQLGTCGRIELEPGGLSEVEGSGNPLAAQQLPVQLNAGKALADGIEQVEDQVFEVRQVLEYFIEPVGLGLFGLVRVARRQYLPIHRGQGAATLADLRQQVRVLLLHVLEQLALGLDVALFCRPQDGGQAWRSQPVGGVVGELGTKLREPRRLLLLQGFALQRLSVNIN